VHHAIWSAIAAAGTLSKYNGGTEPKETAMPDVKINGMRLNYELHGESGPPLVLVHGYTGDITDWRPQLPAFSPSYRMLIVDLRGHGQSEAPADRSLYTIGHFADEVEALIDEIGFPRYHLLGHSMGGAVVQEIALRSPERLLSLTLYSTTDDFSVAASNGPLKVWTDYRFSVAEKQGMEALARMTSPFPPPPHMPAERTEEMVLRMSRMSVDSFIGAWHGLTSWQGTRGARSSSISLQTLVIYGELDTGFLVEGAKSLAKNIPNARLVGIPEAAHSSQWERPALFNAALGAFLNEVSGER
jgi:pimeloyl-ACP methyl ester carboxylesterase